MKSFYMVMPFVIAFIEDAEGKILVGKHPNLSRKPYPLHWDFPGGKVEPTETIVEGLFREVKEETGFSIVAYELLGVFHNNVLNGNNQLPGLGICYKVKVTGDFKPTELSFMTFRTKNAIKKLKLTPWAEFFIK